MPGSVLLGIAALALGLTGLVLPVRWNPLTVRRSLAASLSPERNLRNARALGCLVSVAGALLLAGHLLPDLEEASDLAVQAGTAAERVSEPSPAPPAPAATSNPHPDDVALFSAIEANDLEAMEAAIRGLADLDAPNSGGIPPLCWAVRNGHAELVDSLLLAGADPNSREIDGTSALALARRNGDERLVELLLEAGAES